MISKDCTITIDKGNASVDEDVYLYKNDMNIQILFTIVNNKYRYTKNTAIDNIIANNKASYAQVKFKKGDIEIDFEEQETKDGAVVLLIKKELIDEDTELGDYSIQIRLFDENKTSVITLPPVENCIHIQRPLFEKAGEDTNIVDQAFTDMAVVTYAEPISATNSDGTYNKKTWISKEKITTAELNRMEEGISNVSTQYKEKGYKTFATPEEFGAKGDGITDDTKAIQDAINSGYNTVIFSSKKYLIKSLDLKRGCSLIGTYAFDTETLKGTILNCTDENNPAITINGGNLIQNIAFYYPNQSWNSDILKPAINYPATIKANPGTQRIKLDNLLFINPYIAMDFSVEHEYIVGTNIQGYALYKGLIIDNGSDIDRFKTVHFNYNTIRAYNLVKNADEFAKWTRDNGTAFDIGRSDWSVFDDIFCWSYIIGVSIRQVSSKSPTHGIKIINSGFDACRTCLYTENMKYVNIVNCEFTAFHNWDNISDKENSAINIASGQSINIIGCNFWGCSKECIVANAERVIISNNGFYEFGKKAVTYNEDRRAILLKTGSYIISNNIFNAHSADKVCGILCSTSEDKITTCLVLSSNIFENFSTTVISSVKPTTYKNTNNVFINCTNSTLDNVIIKE